MSVIDISSKLGKEKPRIQISDDKIYVVNTSADTYLIVQEKLTNKNLDVNSIYEMIQILLGEDALKEIKAMKPTINDLTVIMIAISALVNEVSYEEMEEKIKTPIKV